MGPQRKHNHITTILAEKDEQIEKQGLLIEAYRARASHIQTRLLATLDVLDEVRASHMRELASETQAKERLSDKLDRYIDGFKVAEMERDDLRDAVERLIKKVEQSNDYGLWPHSRIQITSLVDPIAKQPDVESNAQVSDKELLGYASAMIAALRLERDVERQAHNKTRQYAESLISTLDARVACREAELESCVTHTECFSEQKLGYVGRDDLTKSSTMTHEEMIKVLDMTSAKNKALELEVKIIAKRLEQARSLARQEPVPATSSPLSPLHAEISASPLNSSMPTPLERVSNPRHHSDIHHAGTLSEDPELTIRAAMAGQPPRFEQPFDIEGLDREIKHLASKVDAFKVERDLLSQIVAAERPSSEFVHPGTPLERLLSIEEECVRLRKSEEKLKATLEESNRAASMRERQLIQEIENLQRLVREQNSQKVEPPGILEAFDGELSMELATPLFPTSLLPTLRSRSHSRPSSANSERGIGATYVDPPSIPLPLSPVPLSPVSRPSPRPSPPTIKLPSIPSVTLPRHSSPTSSGILHLQRVERELADAKRQLEEGENMASEWHNVLQGLHFNSG